MRGPALLVFPSWLILVALVCVLGGCEELSGDEAASTTSASATMSESSSTTSLADGSTATSGGTTGDDLESVQPAAPRGAPTILALDPQQGPENGGDYVDIPGVYEVGVLASPGGPTRVSSDSAADFLFMDPSLLPTLPTFETIVYP